MKVVTVQQMRDLEAASERRSISTNQLMENAGLAVAEQVRKHLGALKGEHIAVLVGRGNNGGDGLVAARHLNDWGARVHTVLCAPRTEGDPKLEELRDRAVDIMELRNEAELQPLERVLATSALVIDAILGTGRSRPLQGTMRAALEQLQAAKQARPQMQVLALDIPTGLDADTGACDPVTPPADLTVTLGFPKAGLFSFPGAGRVGRLVTVDIGIPADLASGIQLDVASDAWVQSILPQRPLSANKGAFGRVMIVAGSAQYIGAAYLACAAAVRSGAGLVTLATPASLVPVIAAQLPEVTYLPLEEAQPGVPKSVDGARHIYEGLGGYNTLLVGCGLGQRPQTVEMVRFLLRAPLRDKGLRVVVDADGLNILAHTTDWWQRLQAEAVLTPHPGEMGRLAGTDAELVQADRLKAARESAARWRKTVLLKGAYSLTVAPEGQAVINPFANPGLASAGTGDVLAGLVAGLLAQGLSTFHAAAAAAYVHGLAAELVRDELGDMGMAASDLLPMIPRALRRLRAG